MERNNGEKEGLPTYRKHMLEYMPQIFALGEAILLKILVKNLSKCINEKFAVKFLVKSAFFLQVHKFVEFSKSFCRKSKG